MTTQLLPEVAVRPRQFTAVLIFAALVSVFDAYDLVTYGATLPSLRAEWGMDERTAGLLGSLAPIGMLIGAPLAGHLTLRFGKGPMIITALVWFSVFTPLSALASNPEAFGTLRLLTGIGLGGVLPPLYSMVHEMAPRRHQALTLIIAQCGFCIGGVSRRQRRIWVIPHWGWQGMYLLGGLPLLTLVPWALWARLRMPSTLGAPCTPRATPATGPRGRASEVLTCSHPACGGHAAALGCCPSAACC